MIQQLREVLAKRPITRLNEPKKKISAVLVPVFLKAGKYHLLFIQRTERVRDHKGQISFPGGAYENADRTVLNTALREASEEIGLSPEDVDILGELDDALTATSNFVISPFVGLIPYPYDFKPDKWETEEILEVPLSVLQDKNNYSETTVMVSSQMPDPGCYKYGDRVIWGATSIILKQMLEIIAELTPA
jgi:8-oxo-dGTP pyrophosphatase MutT (NUDIX family)